MATHDYNIANQGFPAFRTDLNDALAAIVSNNSNATAPATTFAHMIWVDTAANPSVLKIRNADNDAWITIGSLNQTDDKFKLTPADGVSTDTISELTSAAGVTIDGVLLKDNGVVTGAGTVSAPVYSTTGDLNTGIFFPAADTIAFAEGGAEAMRIDSSGRVGIGTTSPGRTLDVSGSIRSGGSTNPFLALNNGTVESYFEIASSNTRVSAGGANALTFITNDAERARIDSSGNLLVGITSARANAGDVQVSKGISFPATQSAQSDANTLDDYEEGTFTPTMFGSISAGTTTHVLQVGKYTKIGNVVFVNVIISWSAATGTGTMELGGLPFTVANGSPTIGAVFTDGLNWPGNTGPCVLANDGSTNVRLYISGDNTEVAIQTVVNEAAGVRFSVYYYV
jgi:hypothetical protein